MKNMENAIRKIDQFRTLAVKVQAGEVSDLTLIGEALMNCADLAETMYERYRDEVAFAERLRESL